MPSHPARFAFARLAALAVCCSITATCGSSPSTAPTTPPATRVISLSGNLVFGSVQIGGTADATFTISNSGTGPLSVTGITVPSGYVVNWTSGAIAAGNSQTVTVHFAPAGAAAYNGSIVVNGDQTSGTNAIAVTGTGVGGNTAPPAPTTVTVSGTVRDGTSGGILPNIQIQIADGADIGKASLTDSSGNYSLTVAPGTFTMALSAVSYISQTREVTLTAASRVDFVLERVPAPAPAPGASTTFLSFVSEPGDYIGQGQSHRYGLQDATWRAFFTSPGATRSLHVSLQNFPQGRPDQYFWWDLDLIAPIGKTLGVGTYEGARRAAVYEPQPGLDFSGSGRGCNTLTGRFTITAITVGPGNTLDRLEATFDQNCEGGPKALHGQIAVLANPWR